MENTPKKQALQLLYLITTPKLADKAEALFKKECLPIQCRFYAEGTVSSDLMDVLGLGSIDKSVLMTVVPKHSSATILKDLRAELQMTAVNSGIAFTVPLSGVNNFILQMLAQSLPDQLSNSQGKEEVRMSDVKHVLITAIVNRGFSGDVMDAARAAGARGGTVIHSRRVNDEQTSTTFGVTVQEEQEIVMILAESENKLAIMQRISEQCGTHSEAQGLVMSMPCDEVTGI